MKPTPSIPIFAVTLGAGLVFMPDRLQLLGNSSGASGSFLFFTLMLGIVVCASTVRSYGMLISDFSHPGGEIQELKKILGARTAASVSIGGILPFAVCASAGILVSAGFAFNEVFVYWFPNFAFAYLLLAAVLLVNIRGRDAVRISQAVSVAVAGVGMIVLTVAAVFAPPVVKNPLAGAPAFQYRSLVDGLVLLIGFDMALYAGHDSRQGAGRVTGAMMVTVLGSGLLLALWGLGSMLQVPASKLISSTVPHMVAARTVLGQTGRIIMGCVVVFGVFGAVNALFYTVGRMAGALTEFGDHSADRNTKKRAVTAAVVLAASATALLMAMGMAGEPKLEAFIRAGMVLWLMRLSVVNASAVVRLKRFMTEERFAARHAMLGLGTIAAAFTALAAAGLMAMEPHKTDMVLFLLTVSAMVWIVIAGLDIFLRSRKNRSA